MGKDETHKSRRHVTVSHFSIHVNITRCIAREAPFAPKNSTVLTQKTKHHTAMWGKTVLCCCTLPSFHYSSTLMNIKVGINVEKAGIDFCWANGSSDNAVVDIFCFFLGFRCMLRLTVGWLGCRRTLP